MLIKKKKTITKFECSWLLLPLHEQLWYGQFFQATLSLIRLELNLPSHSLPTVSALILIDVLIF